MVARKPLAEYMRLVHMEGCDIDRNIGMSPLAEHTVNKVMGQPKCDCGLDAARRRPNRNEMEIQCEQHFGEVSICCLVQLRHQIVIHSEWQEPRWVCAKCRSYLTGQFRFCNNDQFIRYLELAKGKMV